MSIMRINVGPIHPSTHGVLRLVVDVDGDTVKDVEPHIGFLHRGVEKLMENRMYMQSPSYTEKLDYVASFCWDDLYVSTVELAVGNEVKEAAQVARVVMLEFQRIASHLIWLGTQCNELGQMFTMFMWCMRERQEILKFMEDVSGTRMFYVNLRLGGFNKQLPSDFVDRAYKLTDYLESNFLKYPEVTESNPIFMERMKGAGILDRETAIEYGVSGPVLRGSGVEYDIRKKMPYYIYDKIKFDIPTGSKGDNFDRYRVRYREMLESIRIIRQALEMMPKNPDVMGLPIKLIGPSAKPDRVVNHRELPKGEGIIYMVPDKQKPYRISLRSPTFINLSVLPKIAQGAKFADLVVISGSLDLVMGEIDR